MAKRKIIPSDAECSGSKQKCYELEGSELLTEDSKSNKTLKLWLEIFPDGEPEYFYKKYNEIQNDADQIEEFIARNLDHRNYPKRLTRRNIDDKAEKKFYQEEYSVGKFVERFPNAIKYFLDENRTSSISKHEALKYARNR